MYKNRLKILIFALLFLALGAALSLAPLFLADSREEGGEVVGLYTFEREAVMDGKTVKFFESGDQYYHYYHDKNGFLLVREDSGVYYAVNKDGRPISSGVKLSAPEYRIRALNKMTPDEVDLAKNSDLIVKYDTVTDDIENNKLYGYINPTRPLCNFIIYIMFNNEGEDVRYNLSTDPAYSYFNGSDNSLRDYFYKMSNGELIISNFTPYDTTMVYVYKDSHNRSYYNVKEPQSTRGEREAKLLTNAVNAAKDKFGDLSGYNLDINNDNYLDGVSFIVSGSDSGDWGNLLWPHSWDLTSINISYNGGAIAAINGIKVGNYSFNFMSSLDVGVLCHEFNHVLGAPDLYHYSDDYAPVGDWDLMQYNKATPQYSLTYMRNKYIGGIGESQISTLNHNGVYSLKPVSMSGQDDILAYRTQSTVINGKNEYFMFEYRNPNVSVTYDNMLPGAGLIVYRIREGVAEGNKNAQYQSTSKPDEVFVFRPVVYTESNGLTRFNNSKLNLKLAYLSPLNSDFSSIGKVATSTNYDTRALYYTNGKNSGIVLNALGISNTSIEFKVQLNGDDNIDNSYFNGKAALSGAKMVNDNYSGVQVDLTIDDIELSYLSNIEITLKNAGGAVTAVNTLNIGKFHEAYNNGARTFESAFVVSDKGGIIGGVFKRGVFDYLTAPASAEFHLTDADGDRFLMGSAEISLNGLTWPAILNTKFDLKASIEAASRITLGVKTDGTVVASGGFNINQWAVNGKTNIISAAAGTTHTLLLNKSLTVEGLGINFYGETLVSGWTDIRAVSAGHYTSYGVKIDGTVIAAGINNHNQLNVSSWTDIIDISAGYSHVAALKSDGTVVGAGDNSGGQLDFEGLSDIIEISSGNGFTACLKADNTVSVAGALVGKNNVKTWSDIVKISAGASYLYGLTSDGRVLSAGDNSYGQCETESLLDIIDMAAGEYHGAFLRKDGVVVYCGTGNSQYKTNDPVENLIYREYVDVSGVALSLSTDKMYVGDSQIVSAEISPLNATYKRIIYTSSDTSVATVNLLGKVTALKAGVVRITATANGTAVFDVKTITVLENVPPSNMYFADLNKSVKLGETAELVLVFEPSNATVISNYITFISSDTSIVLVDNGGRITALALGNATITASYNYGGIIYTANCTVKVVSDIEYITINALPAKLIYYYNENFDVSGGKLNIRAAGDSADTVISMSPDMISGYNKQVLGPQTITVNYMDKTVTFTITVFDYVESVELYELPVTEFIYGQPFSVEGGKVKLINASGSFEIRTLMSNDVSGYDPYKVGPCTLTVRLVLESRTFELLYQVKIEDTVNSITGNLIKRTYNFYEDFNDSETIILNMSSGAKRSASVSEAAVTGFVNDVLGSHSLVISYTDAVTGIVHRTTEIISVNLSGEFTLSGCDDEGVFWYDQNGTLIVNVLLSIGGAEIVVSSDNTRNIWYQLANFDNTVPGPSQAQVRIFVKSNVDQAGYREVYVQSIDTFGITAVQSHKFIGVKEYYLYGETPSIKIEFTLETGTKIIYTPVNPVYDPEKLGESQEYKVRYANVWYSVNILIINYATAIAPIGDKTIKFGETLNLIVYAVMAKGENVVITSGWSCVYNSRILGAQTVTVRYSGELGDLAPVSFTLTVVDGVSAIIQKAPIKTVYLYGEAFDPSSVYTVTMLSGTVSDINYNSNDFTHTEFFPQRIGKQTITIRHKETGTTFTHEVYVNNYCVSIEIDPLSKLIYKYNEPLNIIVNAVNADGSRFEVVPSLYTTTYVKNKLGTQAVTVRYGNISTTFSVLVNDEVTSLSLKAPGKIEYRYGEALSLAGGELNIVYLSGRTETVKNSAIATYNITFDPLKSGYQNIIIKADNKSVSYQVRVAQAAEKDLFDISGEGVKINTQKYTVIYNDSATVETLNSAAKTLDYLRIIIKNADGEVIDPVTDSQATVKSGWAAQIVNESGLIVRNYTIYIRGDGNNDGVFDMKDMDYLAEQYLSDTAVTDSVDYNGDGVFSLTDLINLAREAAKKQELPPNAMAKNFVSDIKPRKEENNED